MAKTAKELQDEINALKAELDIEKQMRKKAEKDLEDCNRDKENVEKNLQENIEKGKNIKEELEKTKAALRKEEIVKGGKFKKFTWGKRK